MGFPQPQVFFTEDRPLSASKPYTATLRHLMWTCARYLVATTTTMFHCHQAYHVGECYYARLRWSTFVCMLGRMAGASLQPLNKVFQPLVCTPLMTLFDPFCFQILRGLTGENLCMLAVPKRKSVHLSRCQLSSRGQLAAEPHGAYLEFEVEQHDQAPFVSRGAPL